MKFKFENYGFTIEAEFETEEERRELMKIVKRTIVDLSEDEINRAFATVAEKTHREETSTQDNTIISPEPERLASDKQKAFMDKLQIPYTEYTTLVEAADLIKSWKVAHGYNV